MESRDPPKDLHLSQPLTYRHQRIAFQTPSHRMKIPKKSPMFREMEFMSQHFLGLEVLEWTLAKIQWYLLQEWIPPTTTLFMSEFNQAIEVSSFVMELNKDSIQNSASFKVFEGIDLTQDDIKTLTPYYLRKCYFGEAVCMTSSKTCQKQFPWDIDLNTRVCTYIEPRQFAMRVSPNLCSFVFPNHGVYVGSRDHFVMLYDLMEQRYNLRLHCMLERKSNQPTLPPWRIFDRLLKWGDDLLRTIGEEAYPIIYKLEPACISYLVGDLPVGVPNGPTFKAWVRQSLQESNLDDRVLGCADRLFSILDDVHATNPHYTIQCFGMFRIWGHPTVDPLLGVSKLQEISKKVRSFNLDNVVDIDCTFKEEFLRRYIRHHGCWPEVDVSQFPSHNIIRKSYEQGGSFPYNNKLYSRKHLVLLKFKAFFPIDPKFELSELLNDKAGSLPMDELLEAIGHGHCGESTDRSVLVNWLKSYLHDPQQFLQEISENGFPQRECGIGCKGKEKEGKVAARMFSLLSITKRMYIVLTEALLAQHVLKYFPEITMLDDGITLDQKRFAFSKPSENRIRYFTSIDFTKWNSNMRENETLGLFRCFDQMFGLKNCFARTHEMFKGSVIYLLDGSYLPPVNATGDGLAEDIGTIHSHLGGLEGLRQKGWTIWTTMLLLKCARGLDVKISLMGQGDNQVIGETYSSTKTEDVALETHYTLLARLNEFLRETGPPLKLSETYTSQKCVMYGKYVIYDGVAVSMSAKKSIKLSKLTNESYSTLESSVSALSATCMSAIESDHSAESIYRMYLMELAMCFQYHLRSSLLRREPMTKMATDYTRINIAKESRVHLNDEMIRRLSYSNIPSFDLLVRLMLCPRVLGGYPILHLYSTIVKGTPDEVVECLSIFKNMHLTANEATRRILVTLASPVLTEHPNYKLLFEHPTALSLAHPPSPADCRRNKVLEYLNGEGSSMIHNPFFKEFLQLASEDNEKNEQLVIRLSAVYPFSPRILSMIYASTPDARARAVIGKIQKTGTLAKLLVRSGENLISIISKAELNHFKGVIRMLYSRGTNEWSPEICSVDFAQKLRRVGWQRDIVGVTIAAPLEIGWIDAPHRVNGCPVGPQIPAEGFVGFSLDALLSHEQLENVGVMGNYAPYRGSCTKSKVSSLGSTLIQHADSLLKKPLQAVSLINWGIAKGGNLAKFVEEVLSTMTDADPSALIPENEAICGSIQHRLQDDRTSHGGSMSLLFNMGTKIGINTSPLVNHCKGSSNTNLMFQTIMVFGVSLTGMALKGRIFPDSTGVHFHLKSNCCIKPADEEPIEALLPIPIDDCIHYNRNSPYLFKPSQHIIQDLVNRLSREPNRGLPKTPQALSDRKAAVVAEECMKMMRMVDFSGEGSLSSPVTINWALGIDGGSWIRNLTLRIISYISLTSPVEDESPQFLGTIAGILAMTDYSHWRKLSNMWFMERMLTQASSPPWYTRVQGNPQFSPNEVGKLIRNWVVAVIHAWRELKDPYLGSFPCYSRPSGPPDQHPGHLMTVRRYILREIDGKKFKKVSLSIRKLLRQIEPEPNTEAVKMIFEGDKFLTAESTDHLAKAAPSHQIVSPEAEPICVRNLAGQGVRLISSPKDHETMTMTDPKTQLDVNMKITAWSHMWKTATGATTAPYKLLDILCTLKIADAPFRGVLCTGDGSGGYTQLCSRLYQNADIYYNTLKIPSISVQQCDPITQLPAFAPYPSLESRVKGIDMVNDGLSDLTHPQYCDAFMHRYHPKQIDLITCDAEGGGWESPIKALKIATTLKKLGVRNKAQFIIMKSYTSSPYLIRTSMTVFLSAYSSVEIYRTPYSSQGNTEVFIVASNLRSEGQLALNIGYPSSEEGKCSVTGPTFSDHEWTKIESKLKRKELYEQQPNTIAALVMTQLMSPHDKEARDDAAVFIELPWAKMGSHICYPNDIVNRLYKFLLPYSEKLSDAGRRGAIKTLKRTVMTCVAAQLLVIWSLAMKNHPDTMDRLQQLFDSGYIVAFKTLNKNYDYSLTLNKITETTLVKRFPLCEIISKANQKVIIKLIGVLESRGTTASITSEYSHSWERGSLDNHGKRLANGRLAMNNEVKRLINHIDPKSPNVPYEQVPQIEGLHPLSIPTLKGYLGD